MSGHDPHPISRRRASVAFVATIGAMGLMPLAVTGTNLAFPEIEQTFDASRSVLSWALSGYSIVLAAFTLLGGQLSDRWDARRAFIGGIAIYGVASLITGVAPNEAVLIAGRAIQGVGGALIVPASLVVLIAQFPTHRHGFIIGVWTAAFPIGSALAPTLAAVMLELGSWRWVFLMMAVSSLLMGALAAIVPVSTPMPAATSAPDAPPDYLGTVVGTASVGLVALGIVEGPVWGWTNWRTITVVLLGFGLAPLFVRRSLRHPRPLMDLRLFRYRTFSVATLANVFISAGGIAVWLLWPLVMANQWGYSQIKVGLAISITPAIAGAVSLATAGWARRHGYGKLLIPGSSCLVVANIWYLTVLGPEPDYAGHMLPGLLLYGVGIGLTFAPVNAAALSEIPASSYGQANGGFATSRFLAGALGIAAVIAALGEPGDDPFAGYDRAFALLAILSGLVTLLLIVAWPRQLASQDAPSD